MDPYSATMAVSLACAYNLAHNNIYKYQNGKCFATCYHQPASKPNWCHFITSYSISYQFVMAIFSYMPCSRHRAWSSFLKCRATYEVLARCLSCRQVRKKEHLKKLISGFMISVLPEWILRHLQIKICFAITDTELDTKIFSLVIAVEYSTTE